MFGLLNLFKRAPEAIVAAILSKERQWRLGTDAFANFAIEGEVTETPTFVRAPRMKHDWGNSTEEFYWAHPGGHPFSVEGGPLGGDGMPTEKPWPDWQRVWTNVPALHGYRLVMDNYSDRIYLVWKGDRND